MSATEKMFGPVIKFFGILASSLTGISAVFTAVGFLAERSRLVMLGFVDIPVDLNQYLYTGAKLFGYLPFILVYGAVLNLLSALTSSWVLLVAVILVVLSVLWWVLGRFDRVKTFNQKILKGLQQLLFMWRLPLITLLVMGQFMAIYQLFIAVQIDNLLFDTSRTTALQETDIVGMQSQHDLRGAILAGNETGLVEYISLLLLVAVATGFLIWGFLKLARRSKDENPGASEQFGIVVTLVLFCTQLILIPINFGILLLPNHFPVVKVVFEEAKKETLDVPTESRLVLLSRQQGDVYLYSPREKRIWLIKRSDLISLEYRQMEDVFSLIRRDSG